MVFRGSAGDIPNLLKPAVELLFADPALVSLRGGRLPIAPRLPLHENEFHIVLDDGIGLVGFSEELGTVGDLIRGIGDLVPDDRIQIVKANSPTDDANVSMKRKNKMAPEGAPGDTNIPDNANQTSTGNQDSVDVSPDLLQLEQERFVVLNVSGLIRILVVPFEIPVGRRRDR